MIVAVWFTTIGLIMLVGFGLVILTFRHWIIEHNKRKRLADESSLLK